MSQHPALDRLSKALDRADKIEDAARQLRECLDWHDVFRRGTEGLPPEDREKVRLARLNLCLALDLPTTLDPA